MDAGDSGRGWVCEVAGPGGFAEGGVVVVAAVRCGRDEDVPGERCWNVNNDSAELLVAGGCEAGQAC